MWAVVLGPHKAWATDSEAFHHGGVPAFPPCSPPSMWAAQCRQPGFPLRPPTPPFLRWSCVPHRQHKASQLPSHPDASSLPAVWATQFFPLLGAAQAGQSPPLLPRGASLAPWTPGERARGKIQRREGESEEHSCCNRSSAGGRSRAGVRQLYLKPFGGCPIWTILIFFFD